MGKQREAAVNKYLDDPNHANHAEAEDLKRKLDGMVDDLNQLRGQVDVVDGETDRLFTSVLPKRSQKRAGNGCRIQTQTQIQTVQKPTKALVAVVACQLAVSIITRTGRCDRRL